METGKNLRNLLAAVVPQFIRCYHWRLWSYKCVYTKLGDPSFVLLFIIVCLLLLLPVQHGGKKETGKWTEFTLPFYIRFYNKKISCWLGCSSLFHSHELEQNERHTVLTVRTKQNEDKKIVLTIHFL